MNQSSAFCTLNIVIRFLMFLGNLKGTLGGLWCDRAVKY